VTHPDDLVEGRTYLLEVRRGCGPPVTIEREFLGLRLVGRNLALLLDGHRDDKTSYVLWKSVKTILEG
jgi:hypothetical protein